MVNALPLAVLVSIALYLILRRGARRVQRLARRARLAWMVPLGVIAGLGVNLVLYLVLGDEVRLLWLPCAAAGAAVGAGLAALRGPSAAPTLRAEPSV
jgi:hypothetical protein